MLLLGCGSLYDPEDCRVEGDQELGCSLFVPEGQVCGLMHGARSSLGGSPCLGRDPTAELAPGTPPREVCPVGYSRSGIADVTGAWYTAVADPMGQGFTAEDRLFCAAVGNAQSSSGDLGEVPNHAACGLSSTGKGYTNNSCLGMDPLTEGCPTGYERRFSVDRGSIKGHSYLLVWCELQWGCEEGACGDVLDEVDLLCGLQDSQPPTDVAALEAMLDTTAMHATLVEWVFDQVASGVPAPTCWGGSPLDDTCPSGFSPVCIEDGTTPVLVDALCWCAPD